MIVRPRLRRVFCGLLAATLVSSVAAAATPPAGSPIALRQHPRLFFTQSDVPAIRTRIATHYRSEFQNFLDLLDDTSVLSSAQKNIEPHWGAINYAFVAALDPASLAQQGFSFTAPLTTSAAYCGRAVSYANALLPSVASAIKQGHGDMSQGFPLLYYIPVMAVYDWCYPHLTSTDRQRIVDAFVSAYNIRYAGQNLMNMKIDSTPMLANNWASAVAHDILGILAFYGDSYPSAQIQQDMYDAFSAIWFDRLLFELNYFYQNSTHWHEGPGGYFDEGYLSIGIPFSLMSSALAQNFIGDTPFFRNVPQFLAANLMPHSMQSQCGPSGNQRCPEYSQRWGDIALGIFGVTCKAAILNSGQLRAAGQPSGLAKWLHSQASHDCPGTVSANGGPWSNAVLYWFLYGDAEVTPKSDAASGLPLSVKLGMNSYVFKSGYSPNDSQVNFFAPPYTLYGHFAPSFGQFTIHKYGGLILKAGNAKGGEGRITDDSFNLMQNVVGIHKGSADPKLDFNNGALDPTFKARGIDEVKVGGKVLAERLGGTFDYVHYDAAAKWNPSTADVYQREFVYVRGPENSEYVVLFDRVNTPSPSGNEKIWKAWVPVQPRVVNGTSTNPRSGKWLSSNATIVEVENEQPRLQSSYFESAPTHGRLYLTALSPASPVIQFIGGPGAEFQSGDDDGSTPWGAPAMSAASRAYLGWGRIEIRPSTAQAYDTFLTVMQFGDSYSMTSPTSVTRLRSSDNLMLGAHIRDAKNQWVLLFPEHPNSLRTLTSTSYTFQPVAQQSQHFLSNMIPGRKYYVSFTSGGSQTTVTVGPTATAGSVAVTADADGLVQFTLNGLVVVPPSSGGTAPGAPRNVRVTP